MNLVCLVSRQAMPNVLPVLMYKPEKVFLLMTDQEKSCGLHLKALFEKKGLTVECKEGIDAYNPETITQKLEEINSQTKFQEAILNVTGGTKLMAIAAYEYFSSHNKPVIYCDTENKKIIHLQTQKFSEEISVELTISDFLAAYGYKIEEEKYLNADEGFDQLFSTIEESELLEEFVKFSDKVRKELNEGSNTTINSNKRNFAFQKTPSNFILRLLKVNPPLSIKFQNKDFIYGDWLEYYVYRGYKQNFPADIKSGVQIVSDDGIRNEIDLMILKDYKLYLVSCKSGKTENAALYELETLRTIAGGTFGKGILVSSGKISASLAQRSAGLKIDVNNILKRNSLKL